MRAGQTVRVGGVDHVPRTPATGDSARTNEPERPTPPWPIASRTLSVSPDLRSACFSLRLLAACDSVAKRGSQRAKEQALLLQDRTPMKDCPAVSRNTTAWRDSPYCLQHQAISARGVPLLPRAQRCYMLLTLQAVAPTLRDSYYNQE